MGGLVARLGALALTWGAPGLFFVAFLDSSFLPLPGITDLLLIVLVAENRQAMLVYVLGAVAGSLAGCLSMYWLGRAGGEALVRRRFTGPRIERARAALQRHGVMAVLIPSLLPPPAPFKIFLLLAGVVGISVGRFASAILIGRTGRYLVLGFLAVRYGHEAQTHLLEHGARASMVVVLVLVAAFLASLVWRATRRAPGD